MKLTIEIELTDQEIRMLQDNSIERVHQTATNALGHGKFETFETRGDAWSAYHDLKDFGPLASKLWNSARNAAYIALAEKKK